MRSQRHGERLTTGAIAVNSVRLVFEKIVNAVEVLKAERTFIDNYVEALPAHNNETKVREAVRSTISAGNNPVVAGCCRGAPDA